ncbi:MAG: hypothetical protein ACK421_08215 [Pseudanabaenaceae cyanobacterium]
MTLYSNDILTSPLLTDRVNGLVTTIVAGASAVVILSPLSRLVVRSLGLD